MKSFIGVILILLSITILISVFYRNSKYSKTTREFSSYTLLTSSWEKYKLKFIEDGRVVDHSQNDITTSEGQSYAMLRSVWMDDRETFDETWKWTRENLDRPKDKLFGWKWGKRSDNTYNFLENGGQNAAADADSDIALALIFASSRWGERVYLDDAKKILDDLWKIETATANGKRYIIAGNWAQSQDKLVINPSYFAPYAWKIFAKVDKKHDWESLVDPAYELLARSGKAELNNESGVGLPPDWVEVDRKTGSIQASKSPDLKTTFSYDALRVPFRISLDYVWNKDERAKNYLTSSYKHLDNLYVNEDKLVDTYGHNGDAKSTNESPAMYSGVLGYFMVTNPDIAQKMYEEKIIRLYSNDQNGFKDDLPYYEQNMMWFAVGLYNNSLINYYNQ